MQEQRVFEEPLPRVVAEDHPVDAVKVRVARHPGAVEAPGILGDEPARLLGAPLRVRVRREPIGHPAAARLADPPEHVEHLGHLAGVVGAARQVAEAELVGLALVVARVAEEEQREARLRQAAELRHPLADDHADAEAE